MSDSIRGLSGIEQTICEDPFTNCEDRFVIDPSGEKKCILSIDGGGMRGTISIAMLAELEAQTGKSCHELFDMVVGTSTGAIIAVGLCIGYSAQELLEEVYKKRLPQAFGAIKPNFFSGMLANLLAGIVGQGNLSDFLARIFSNGFKFAYPLKPFEELLVPIIEGKFTDEQAICHVGDLQYPAQPILLVTTKDVSTSNTYFVVSEGPGKKKFRDWPLSGAVASSGAAPVFFPPVVGRLVDGGVGVYSNPCLMAATEALEYIAKFDEGQANAAELAKFSDQNVILVSLGTGYVPNIFTPEKAQQSSVADWLQYVISESLDDAALQQVFITRAIYGKTGSKENWRVDFRRYNPLLTRESLQDCLGLSLAGKPDPRKFGLDSFEQDQIELMVEIGKQYARRICWSEPHVMPWQTPGGHHFPDDVEDAPVDWRSSLFACDS